MTDASARPIRAYQIINCAGPWAGKIAEMAGIGTLLLLLWILIAIFRQRKRPPISTSTNRAKKTSSLRY